ncbi:MAG: flagellar hook-basal body complex protein FliE, partial [Rhodocyclaceae bacterium]|nr:flagellar hook-basal body complex protein FliE [Rhodocyclaceae bacterium]
MDTRGIEQMLTELRSTAQAAGAAKPATQGADAEQVDFSEVLQNALKDVSAAQQEARQMSKDFQAGDPNVNLQDVMVNL